ncbi:hypothetical protein FRC00_004470, partial [Tulasnella sp. 408]
MGRLWVGPETAPGGTGTRTELLSKVHSPGDDADLRPNTQDRTNKQSGSRFSVIE